MSFARTFLQTSRALCARNSINPVQQALSARGQAQFARSYATVFERNKPHVNIGTIGHVDHGKVDTHSTSSKNTWLTTPSRPP